MKGAHRINAAWMNWKKMTGVLCNRRMNVRGKIHKIVVRPAMLYGSETWALMKVYEKRLEVAEMRMLRWSCGVARMDRIRNSATSTTCRFSWTREEVIDIMDWTGKISHNRISTKTPPDSKQEKKNLIKPLLQF
uniref:Uncharacterized protein n=1 Tax=Cacopsylla melanoneura TaxID=428564 RepID=A0A8D9FCJ3_9HEMI